MADRIDTTPSKIRDAMLNWYDSHARELPWRSKPGLRPDPYHVWMSEIMLQQTTVGAVIPYFEKFISIWPSVKDLANANQEEVLREWAGLGYYSRARNLYKCAVMVVNDYEGIFPSEPKELKKLPGIGDYTSAAIASIAYDIPATVIDGNVERVVSRLYRIEDPLPDSKPLIRKKAEALFIGSNTDRPSCFAQSLMDLGATICTPKSPKCMLCPINQSCQAYIKGDAHTYPRKKPKKKLPEKHAVAYIYLDNGEVGVETRPEKGMLGGMVGFPTSEWCSTETPLAGQYNENYKVRHVFTHFALTLYPKFINKRYGRMVKQDDINDIGLPILFKKLWNMIKSEI